MFPIRIKACSESDLRMLGDLARNIQRVLPVTQADIDAAAALGKGWVVWKVIEVSDPLDNLRGGTQLVIKQNSVQPGQNVRRVIFVSGPGGETVVIGPAPSPLSLPDAIANSLKYVKAFGGTEQNGTPTPTNPVPIMTNNGVLTAYPNLFDSVIEQGNISSNNGGNTSSSSRCRTSGYIMVVPNKTYTISANINGYVDSAYSAGIFVYQYNADESEWITSGWKKPSGYTFTTMANTTKIRLVFAKSASANIVPSDITNVQLRQGTSANEIYTNGLTETIRDAAGHKATAQMLLSVGDYKDEQNITTGAITRRVGVKVLDGTENWGAATTSGNRVFMTNLIGAYQYPLICTHFVNGEPTTDNIIYIASGTQVLRIRYDTASDQTAFKSWLATQYAAGTPVIVVYPLATPTTESVAGQALQVQAGDNTLEITQASIDGLELEAEYEQGVQASVQEIEP